MDIISFGAAAAAKKIAQRKTQYYSQEEEPTSTIIGDIWGIPSTGKEYTRVSDGSTTTWLDSSNSVSSAGDMARVVYDTNASGIVDNAEKVNNLTVETAVPVGAVFTDTTYSVKDGELSEISFTTADNDKLDGISGTNTGDQDLSPLAAKQQTDTTQTVYEDKSTDASYKMYMDNGEIVMEEL
ncbi:MAG: hypothetical protein DRO11_08090 [Methanobacteriota archaeon]|nr:MAG: hypothetical protein DRO11_08090 [Euryarchaeota archaeon]